MTIDFNKILYYLSKVFIRHDMTEWNEGDVNDHTQFNDLKIGWPVQCYHSHYSKCKIIEIDHKTINDENIRTEVDN